MKTPIQRPAARDGCEPIRLLLPWYANGTLEPAERAQVEAHLALCPACSREAQGCQELAGAVRGAEPVAPSPHPVQLSRLLARIEEAERPRRREGSEPFGERLRRRVAGFAAAPAALRWALAAQLVLILGLVGALAWDEPGPPSVYRTLSDQAVPPSDATRLRVLFAETATEAEIRRLLLPLQAEITGGPSPLGAYTLALPASGEGGESVSVVLAHLRSQPQVRFAEAVAAP